MRMHQCLVYSGELSAQCEDEEHLRILFYPGNPNGCQLATYPLVSSLHVGALADDTFAKFPWPMIVLPQHPSLPVMVKRVLNAYIANFEERMTQEEFNALADGRKMQLLRAYRERV